MRTCFRALCRGCLAWAIVLAFAGTVRAEGDVALLVGARQYRIAPHNTATTHITSVETALAWFHGERFGLTLQLGALLPLYGSQGGQGDGLWDRYGNRHAGADATVGLGYRIEREGGLRFDVGGGPHINVISLKGDNLTAWRQLVLGLGVQGGARYPLTNWLDLAANVSVAADFIDVLHRDETTARGLSAGLSLGLAGRY